MTPLALNANFATCLKDTSAEKNDIRDVGSTADFSDFAVFLCFFFDSFLFFFDAVVS